MRRRGACAVLEKDQAPGALLTAQALRAAVLLTGETTRISQEEADRVYHQLFTSGTCDAAAIAGSGSPFIAAAEGALEVNPEASPLGLGGAYI